MNSDLELIQSLLKTNPEVVKNSLELAIQCQSKILDVVKMTGMKVMCETKSYNCEKDVPKDQVILLRNDYKQQIQSLCINVTSEVAGVEFIDEMEKHVNQLIDLNNNFDKITAEDIINTDIF